MITENMFTIYIQEPNPECWQGFPELMWDLGFEMDLYDSAPKYEPTLLELHTEKEQQDIILTSMLNWTVQEVGNYIFSRYRELTHWSDYGYPEERCGYFFERAFPILQEKLEKEWPTRNEIPSLKFFSELVSLRFMKMMPDVVAHDKCNFVMSDEGRFHIEMKYNEFINQYKSGQIPVVYFYGVCVTQAAECLKKLY